MANKNDHKLEDIERKVLNSQNGNEDTKKLKDQSRLPDQQNRLKDQERRS